MSDHVREPVQKEMWVPVDGSAAGSLGPWVPGQRGAAPPCRTGGQDWQKPGELPAGRLRPAAVQGTETQWPAPGPPTGQAASHAPSPQRRVSAQSEAAAPGCALRQAPQQGLRAWGQGCPGAAGAFCSQEAGGMPRQETPYTHTHTHTAQLHHPSRPPAALACPSPSWGTQCCRVARVSPTTCPWLILLTFSKLPCAEHWL